MTFSSRLFAPATLTLLLAASPALAQTSGTHGQAGPSPQVTAESKPGGQAKLELPQVSGRILGVKEVKSKAGQTYRVVRLETRGGRTLVADLGPVDGLKDMNLKGSQQVTLSGHPGRIGNRIVFFANEVRTGGQAAQIQRPASNVKAAMRPEMRQVRGQVAKTRQVGVRGGQKNILALVMTQSGQRILVDLGSTAGTKANIQKGQQIAVRGREVRIGDRLILLANQVRAGDQTVDVNRPAYNQL